MGELLKREEALAEKERAHKNFIEEREGLLRKSQIEWRPQVSAYARGDYPFVRSRFQQSRAKDSKSPLEETLLQKHRLDRSIKAYVNELGQLEKQRNMFDEELNTLFDSHVSHSPAGTPGSRLKTSG